MLPPRAQLYLSALRFDPNAERRVCWLPLGGIYWSDEIPDFAVLLGIPEEDRSAIYRLFSIRFRLWSKEVLSEDDRVYWHHCEEILCGCPILRRTSLSPEDEKAQRDLEVEFIGRFDKLCSGADDVKITSEGFSVTFDLKKEQEKR